MIHGNTRKWPSKPVVSDWIHWSWAAIIGLGIIAAVLTEVYLLAGLPIIVLIGYLAVVDFRVLFFLLLASIPISTEFYFPNGLGTDLPTEPLMIGLTLVYFLYAVSKRMDTDSVTFWLHPIALLLLLHISWIFFTTITSDLLFVSVKYALAKTWYVISFFGLTGLLIKSNNDFRWLFWVVFIPLLLTVLITLARHAMIGFSFEEVYTVFHPFHRNHVSYAALVALFFPFLWFSRKWYKAQTSKWWIIILAIPVFLVATYFSYTRAAYISLLIAASAYFAIKFRLIKYAILLASVAAIISLVFLADNNRYLDYAPNYDTTISHTDFDDLLEATYKGEDISTMERVYRWVAGFEMIQKNPVVGVGPGNFVSFYRQYTVNSFRTYVSENEDQSGIHSYYLMTAVEQGIPGIFIFLTLCFVVLIMGERIYHQTKDPLRKDIVMGLLLCLIIIDAFQIINDMLETDKMGPFFFISLAILVTTDIQNQRSERLYKLDAQKDTHDTEQ